MKSPTDFEIMLFIRDHYYNAFASFDKNNPSRLTKIYVPIDVDMIGKSFSVDGDIIFGRLHYYLNKKHSYKNENGHKVELFANSITSDGKTEKHVINFPLLDAIVTELHQADPPKGWKKVLEEIKTNWPQIVTGTLIALLIAFLVYLFGWN